MFFDHNRIELFDEDNSVFEDRFDVIGNAAIGVTGITDDILFVVYTDRIRQIVHGVETDVTRIISARYATEFESNLVICQELFDKYFGKKGNFNRPMHAIDKQTQVRKSLLITYSFPESRVGFCPADQKAYVKIYGRSTRVLFCADVL